MADVKAATSLGWREMDFLAGSCLPFRRSATPTCPNSVRGHVYCARPTRPCHDLGSIGVPIYG
jgi:hypothetical protein